MSIKRASERKRTPGLASYLNSLRMGGDGRGADEISYFLTDLRHAGCRCGRFFVNEIIFPLCLIFAKNRVTTIIL
jgi:hypothetical protein